MWQPLQVSQHPTKSGVDRHFVSGDAIELICHVIKRSCNFMGEKSSWEVTILPSLVAIGIVVVEI